jgi:3-hydroxyisobutyryl-CoA hydrolase
LKIYKSAEDSYFLSPRLLRRLDVIDRCFSRRTVEEIISALEREATQEADGWISATIQALKKGSPASLKISLRSIREGRLQGVGQCLIREYRMVCHVMKGEISKDFVEVLQAFSI